MSFAIRRYELQGACDPIFGMTFTLTGGPNHLVPIIPNIGPLCIFGTNYWHIVYQQIT